MDQNDIREIRGDVKILLQKVASIETQLENHVRPCADFLNHVKEHAKERSYLGWILNKCIMPICVGFVSFLAARYGFK